MEPHEWANDYKISNIKFFQVTGLKTYPGRPEGDGIATGVTKSEELVMCSKNYKVLGTSLSVLFHEW